MLSTHTQRSTVEHNFLNECLSTDFSRAEVTNLQKLVRKDTNDKTTFYKDPNS